MRAVVVTPDTYELREVIAQRKHGRLARTRRSRPDDRLPEPDEDAVIISIVGVEDLAQAWEVVTFMVGAEQVIF